MNNIIYTFVTSTLLIACNGSSNRGDSSDKDGQGDVEELSVIDNGEQPIVEPLPVTGGDGEVEEVVEPSGPVTFSLDIYKEDSEELIRCVEVETYKEQPIVDLNMLAFLSTGKPSPWKAGTCAPIRSNETEGQVLTIAGRCFMNPAKKFPNDYLSREPANYYVYYSFRTSEVADESTKKQNRTVNILFFQLAKSDCQSLNADASEFTINGELYNRLRELELVDEITP